MMECLWMMFSIIILVLSCSISKVYSDARVDIVSRNCSHIIARNTSAYLINYRTAITQLEPQIRNNNGWGQASAGEDPWKMNVLFQCYGDLSATDCQSCFVSSQNILPSCLPHVGGRLYLDGCFLRAANYSFFREINTSEDTLICGSSKNYNITSKLTKLLVELALEAPMSGGVRWGSDSSGESSVYGLANCWNALDTESCAVCLHQAAKSLLSCLPSTDGRSLNAGCMMRYSDYNFLNRSKQYDALWGFKWIISIAVVAGMGISIGIIIGIVVYRHPRTKHPNKELRNDISNLKTSFRFKHSTLDKATDHFSESNRLGQGGFGEVFKGILADGREIAVKRLFISISTRSQDVLNEVNVISLPEHKNLVRFLGCSLTLQDSLLVYEFLPNMSLDRFLFDHEKKTELNWQKRLEVCIGTAKGLKYLHMDCPTRIVHRDIKASNILLDLKFQPKIADFGLAMFHTNENTPFNNTMVAGTLGYMAPEYIATGQLSEKADVYSYGVLVLEILSGVENNKFGSEDSLDTLVTSTWKHFQSNTVSQIIDESLEIEGREEEVLRVAQVGLLCTQEAADLRPTMAEIVQILTDKNVALPQPSKPPFIDECMEQDEL